MFVPGRRFLSGPSRRFSAVQSDAGGGWSWRWWGREGFIWIRGALQEAAAAATATAEDVK
jgi:hypothetical protein